MTAQPFATSPDARPRRVYAGIGSRRTPPETLDQMRSLAADLATEGWHLASGGADGADTAFAEGAGTAGRTVYIPWNGYNRLSADPAGNVVVAASAGHLAEAERHHPAWHRCRQGARKLHGRNSAIILGADLASPVVAVICWTPGGRLEGGTALGIRIAQAHGIPVHNLATATPLAVRAALERIPA